MQLEAKTLTEEFKNDLRECCREKDNKGIWRFQVVDEKSGRSVTLSSAKAFPITRKLITTLEEKEIPFVVN